MAARKTIFCPHCGERIDLDATDERPAQSTTSERAARDGDATVESWPAFKAKPAPQQPSEDESFVWLRKPEREAVQEARERKEQMQRAAAAKPETPSSEEPTETASRQSERREPTAPATRPATPASNPSRNTGGVTVLDVLDTDPTINPGQRETVRMIYQRFAPNVKPAPTEASNALTVLEVLDSDPNLNKGQAETIRTIFAKFRGAGGQPG